MKTEGRLDRQLILVVHLCSLENLTDERFGTGNGMKHTLPTPHYTFLARWWLRLSLICTSVSSLCRHHRPRRRSTMQTLQKYSCVTVMHTTTTVTGRLVHTASPQFWSTSVGQMEERLTEVLSHVHLSDP